MRRRLTLIALLGIFGILATMFGPVAFRLLTDELAEFRGMRELARRERYREEHPRERPLSVWEPEPFLRAAGARAVQVYRLNPSPDAVCPDVRISECFHGHQVLGRIPVHGMVWARGLLADAMRRATQYGGSGVMKPRFGIRFIGATDTTDLLLDTTDSPRVVVIVFQWKDPSGRIRHSSGHMPFPYDGNPDADSTLRSLRRLPQRID